MSRHKNLIGLHFGYLEVLALAHAHNGHAHWLCRCECGRDTVVKGSHLRSGHTVSCGCRRGNVVHGKSRTRLYHIWNGMRERCQNPNNPHYTGYGGRGIYVCKEWQDFENFYSWALESGYSDNLTIDRADNDGGYTPDNCRWATKRTQANNTRKTRMITYNGETHSVSEWARIIGVNQSTLNMRLNKYGWSVEDALGKAVKHNA